MISGPIASTYPSVQMLIIRKMSSVIFFKVKDMEAKRLLKGWSYGWAKMLAFKIGPCLFASIVSCFAR